MMVRGDDKRCEWLVREMFSEHSPESLERLHIVRGEPWRAAPAMGMNQHHSACRFGGFVENLSREPVGPRGTMPRRLAVEIIWNRPELKREQHRPVVRLRSPGERECDPLA